ncbi:S-adenosyl-L-methionine-dependent methyltransferase [Xylaria sp. FL1777]|nr:S-adenosyl-L-methionine-dependent methyltransferase [Xylaria sp. FL1777]
MSSDIEACGSPTQSNMEDNKPDVTRTLLNLNTQLAQCLENLKSLGSTLSESLHHDDRLPKLEDMNLAAQAVDTLHQIQLMLDPPVLILADHFLGYVRSKCLLAAVERGIPDALKQGSMTLADLAKLTHSRNDRLGQILRILCDQGIFTYDDKTRRYSNSPASTLLLSDHWTQWHNWVTLYGTQFYDIARGIPSSTVERSSRTAAQINFDTDTNMFAFFREQEWALQLHRTLGGGATAQLPGILEDYPWYEVADGLVMDIGGGGGDFIAGLLRRYPEMQGGLFDQPHIADHFRSYFESGAKFHDIKGQVQDHNVVGGDFFESVPRCAVYTMKWCLHDWMDAEALAILKNIRKSIIVGPKSRLIVLESILSNRHSGRLTRYGDINMMMTISGQERTEDDWQNLAKSAGWELSGIWDLRRAWVKAMEFRPVVPEA